MYVVKDNFTIHRTERIIKWIYFLPSMTQLPEMDCHSLHGDERKGKQGKQCINFMDCRKKVEE